MSQREPTFLTVDDVLQLHADQLAAFGGGAGLRDRGLLESAVAQASATFDGSFVHDGLLSMAAAYSLHRGGTRSYRGHLIFDAPNPRWPQGAACAAGIAHMPPD